MIDVIMSILTNPFFYVYLAIALIALVVLKHFHDNKLYPCRAYILRKQGDEYVLLKTKKFSLSASKISYRNKTFIVDLKKASYNNQSHPVIFYDYDTGNILTFKNVETKLSAEELDLYLSKHIITQLCAKLSFAKMDLIMMLLFLALGLFMGITIAPYLHPTTTPPPSQPQPPVTVGG